MKEEKQILTLDVEAGSWLSSVAPEFLNYSSIITEWKRNEGLVAGYLSNNIPLEIFHAADIYPVHLKGNPAMEPSTGRQFMEPAFDPITLSVFDSLLTGHFDFLDIIALPRSNDAQQRLYYYLCELKRKYPEYKLPQVKLIDILHTLRPSTDLHNVRILNGLIKYLETKTKKTITEERLQQAVSEYNLSRKLLTEFTNMRTKLPLTINSTIAFSVYAAARCLPVSIFNSGLGDLLKHCRQLAKEDRKRILLAGNGLDYPGLHELIDSQGATIVGDYHAYGNHFLNGQIDIELPPLEAISKHYQRDIKSSRSTEIDPLELVDFAKQQKADGVIFFYLSGEEAWTWHFPKQNAALQKAGFKTLVLTDQQYAIKDIEAANLKEFVASL